MDRAPDVFTLDVETVGEPWNPALLLTGWMYGEKYGYWLGSLEGSSVLATGLPVVTHTSYDVRFLRLNGCAVKGPFYDTRVMAWLLDENQDLSLEALAKRYLGLKMDKRISKSGKLFRRDDGTKVPLLEAPEDQLVAYNRRDVMATHDLFRELWDQLERRSLLERFLKAEVPLTEVLLDMEVRGVPVDLRTCARLQDRLERQASALRAELTTGLPGSFNLASAQQVAAYLFLRKFPLPDRIPVGAVFPKEFYVVRTGRKWIHGTMEVTGLGLPMGVRSEKTGDPSVSSRALAMNLAASGHPWVRRYLEWRKLDKLLGTYVRKFPKIAHEGRLYGRWNQTGTKTGRLSSSDPNLQNIPSRGDLGTEVRGLFRPGAGSLLVVGDYGQLEPRLMAHFSQDENLLHVYRDNLDIYVETARGIFGKVTDYERGVAKTLVLALGYGAGDRKVAEILCLNGFPTSVGTAGGYLNELHSLYPRFFEWREEVIRVAKRKGYVETLSGRRRHLSYQFEDRVNWRKIGYGERQAVNAVIQGSAGNIVSKTMLLATKMLPRFELIAQVHDELVFEVEVQDADRKYLEYLQEIAETGHGFNLTVPLRFAPVYAETWADKGRGVEIAVERREDE